MTVDATKLTIRDAAGTTYPTFTGIDFPTTYFRGGNAGNIGAGAAGLYSVEAFNVSSLTDIGTGKTAVSFINAYSSATALVPTYCCGTSLSGYHYASRAILFHNGTTSPETSASSLSWISYEAFTTTSLADQWLVGLVILGAIA